LRALLSPGKQIAELALASNHHWHARPPGGWNQYEVRIEIEGMSDTDFVPLQVSGKPPPGL
jgi:hypothetical protein